MKKLKLSELNLGNAEILTRGQLKKVLGGLGSGGGEGDANCYICDGDSDASYGYGTCARDGNTCNVPSKCRDYKCDRSWGNG